MLLAVWTDEASSDGGIAVVVILAVLMAVAASFVLLLLHQVATISIPRLLRRFMVWITFSTVRWAIAKQSVAIQPIGITMVDDGVGVVLPVGRNDRVMESHQFVVENAADGEKWGTLGVAWIDENSCTCSVSGRINDEFWANLERRMRSEPSFPDGVIVRRDIPGEFILDRLHEILVW